MKNYLAGMVDLTGDSYINPVGAAYGDGSGTHQRNVAGITSISIHHDAMPRPHDYDSIARYRQEAAGHYARLGPGLQYHYKIDNTGVIFKTRPHNTWLYVVGSSENVSCLAICLDGYLHNDSTGMAQDPTREQLEALYQLLQNLCEQHPEFPATWPQVRPHADYSSTACCGNRMTPHIYPIQDNATAQQYLLNQGVYDWPSLQPAPAPAPTPTPTPAPAPAPVPVVDTTFVPARYVAQVKTHLDDFVAHTKIKDYDPGFEADFTRKISYDGQDYLQTAYSADKTPNRGFPAKDFIVKNPGTPTPPSDPGSVPTPTPPTPPVTPADNHYEERISALEAAVKKILDFLSSLFKGF